MNRNVLADFAIDACQSTARAAICGVAQFVQRCSNDDAQGSEELPPQWFEDHPWLAASCALAIWYVVTAVVAFTR